MKTTTSDLTQLIHQVEETHRPVKIHPADGTDDLVLISQQDLKTAQTIIKAILGSDASFLSAS